MTNFKTLDLFKFKAFSLSLSLSKFLVFSSVVFLFCGCGGGNGDGESNSEISPVSAIFYTISFYDEDFSFINSTKVEANSTDNTSVINIKALKAEFNITAEYLYESSNNIDVSNETNYTITGDTNFYAVSNVVEITEQAELDAIRDNLAGTYVLLNDINLTDGVYGVDIDEGWQPIGDDTYDRENDEWHRFVFTGTFNGNGHKITNLWIDRPYEDYVGLFSHVENATIRNLGIETAESKSIIGNNYVGSITGSIKYGNITNFYFAGDINSSGYNYVGGISGYVEYSNILNSYFSGDISGMSFIGGIAGYVDNGSTVQYNAAINSAISGTNNVNRIVGNINDNRIIYTVSNNFALDTMSVTGARSGDEGANKTIDELKIKTTYSNSTTNGGLGWKFGDDDDNPWKMEEGKNNDLPYFYWQDL